MYYLECTCTTTYLNCTLKYTGMLMGTTYCINAIQAVHVNVVLQIHAPKK